MEAKESPPKTAARTPGVPSQKPGALASGLPRRRQGRTSRLPRPTGGSTAPSLEQPVGSAVRVGPAEGGTLTRIRIGIRRVELPVGVEQRDRGWDGGRNIPAPHSSWAVLADHDSARNSSKGSTFCFQSSSL